MTPNLFANICRSLEGAPHARELAAELCRLSAEIRTLGPDHPLVGGIAIATGMTDSARSAAAPLVSLAAEMIADHARDPGWGRSELTDYLAGLGPFRAADWLARLGAAIGTPAR